MSPMLDVQRRHAEVFRIRMGEKGKNGAPVKLTDAIRITSFSESVVEAFVGVYGGEVTVWKDAPNGEQFQAKLPTTELAIMVLPGQSIEQWWEMYRGSVCERRCDGFTESLSGKPCMCPVDITARLGSKNACRPMTRLHVLCPDVEVVGAGTLVTHGMIAAETLPQSVAVAEAALARGLMVPGTLRVVEHKGKKHYVVPQIEITGVSLNALTTGEARLAITERTQDTPSPRVESAASAQRGLPAAPVPEGGGAPSTPSPSSSGGGVQGGSSATGPLPSQVAQPASPTPSLPPLPGEEEETAVGSTTHATGATEPTADDWDRESVTARLKKLPADLRQGFITKRDKDGLPKVADLTKEQVPGYLDIIAGFEATAKKRAQSVVLACKRAGLDEDAERHGLISFVTDGAVSSAKELSEDQAEAVKAAAKRVADGSLVMVLSEDRCDFLPAEWAEVEG